jgi:prepilin-type processing-associated H-X9-DG protein
MPSVHWGIYYVAVQPYMRNNQMWSCPSSSGFYSIRNCFYEGDRSGCDNHVIETLRIGIATNGDVFGGSAGGWGPTRFLATMDAPAETIMLIENDVIQPASGPPPPPPKIVWTAQFVYSACLDPPEAMWNSRWGVSPSNANGRLGAKHQGGANFAYLDGHVRWLKQPPRDCVAHVGHPAVRGLMIPEVGIKGGECRFGSEKWCQENLR